MFWITLVDNSNCSFYIDDVLLVDGERVDGGSLILRIVADEGYKFDETLEGLIISESQFWDPTFTTVTINSGSWNEDYTICEFDISGSAFNNVLEIRNFKAVKAESPDVDVFNVIAGAYNPTIEELRELEQQRYSVYEEEADIGRFISKLYVLPFNLDGYVGSKEKIVVGGRTLEVQSKLIEQGIITFDIAEIEVPSEYNNAYDYINTRCRLFLPFVNYIEIEPTRVIDKTIKVEYSLDVYSGFITCNVYSDGLLINSSTHNIAKDIPYTQTYDRIPSGSIEGILINNVDVPYIEIERNIPYSESVEFGTVSSQVDIIGNLTGYVEIEKVQLETSATMREQEQIISKLMQGVVIK